MKRVLILQSNYIPWKGYFDLIGSSDEFVVYDEAQYTKNDWRNRNRIKTPTGIQWITIPVYHSLQERISEVKISDTRWNVKHWNTLKSNYAKAPFFKLYKDSFEDFYLNRKEIYLSEINILLISKVMEILGMKTRVSFSRDYAITGDKTGRLVDLCKKLSATEYITGPAAKDYLDESLFTEEGVNVCYYDYTNYPEYTQIYPPFEHNVSILDLIFHCGPEASKFMKYESFQTQQKV